MPKTLTTAQVADLLGISRRAVAKRARAGSLVYTQQLPGATGAYLFDAEQIERIATDAAPTEKEGAAS